MALREVLMVAQAFYRAGASSRMFVRFLTGKLIRAKGGGDSVFGMEGVIHERSSLLHRVQAACALRATLDQAINASTDGLGKSTELLPTGMEEAQKHAEEKELDQLLRALLDRFLSRQDEAGASAGVRQAEQ